MFRRDRRHRSAVRRRRSRERVAGGINISPIESVAGEAVPRGDAKALARCYVERFGLERVYVADLDAIERRAPQHCGGSNDRIGRRSCVVGCWRHVV